MVLKNYRRKGQIAITLIWAFILLIFLAIAFARRASYESKMVSYTWDRAQAFYLTWAAVEEIMKILKEDDYRIDSLKDIWARPELLKWKYKEGECRVDVLYDEERYIDINRAGPVILKRIFKNYPVLYESLLDWLDADNIPRPNGAEDNDPYYTQQGYLPRNGAMRSLFEIYMVKGGTAVMPQTSHYQELNLPLKNVALAHSGTHGISPPNPPPIPWPFPKPIPPPKGPPEKPPEGPPIPIREPTPTGTGLTVYSDGKVNINTALDTVLGALGFYPETIKRILWYRFSGNVFKEATADHITKELLRTGWLKTGEPKYKQIALNIKNIANTGKLKVSSSFFRIRIVSTTRKGAVHTAELVLRRFPDPIEGIKFEIVSWWEKYYL